MRAFSREQNLAVAAMLAAVVTIMALGRLRQGELPLGMALSAMFLAMLFVCGAVAAWGGRAGMAGVTTNRRTLLRGLAVALAGSVLALPLYRFVLDPRIVDALRTANDPSFLALTYPPTLSGRVSLVLWSAGFQALFLAAAPMALFARLLSFARRPVFAQAAALTLTLLLRVYVLHRQVLPAEISGGVGVLYLSSLGATAALALCFARFGLLPAMVLAAGLDAHLFFVPPALAST